MNQLAALNEYRSVGLHTGMIDASSHQMIEMLLQGILDRVSSAKGAVMRGEISRQGENISAAIAIVDSLRASLDNERGGEIAMNLGALYDYLEMRLAEANLSSDFSILDEVNMLTSEILAAWESIPQELR